MYFPDFGTQNRFVPGSKLDEPRISLFVSCSHFYKKIVLSQCVRNITKLAECVDCMFVPYPSCWNFIPLASEFSILKGISSFSQHMFCAPRIFTKIKKNIFKKKFRRWKGELVLEKVHPSPLGKKILIHFYKDLPGRGRVKYIYLFLRFLENFGHTPPPSQRAKKK